MGTGHTAVLGYALLASACQSAMPDAASLRRWNLDPEPEVRIEYDPDAIGYDLHDVAAATRLEDGRIAVVDGGSAEVRFFGRDGAYLGRTGGDGVLHRVQDAVRGGNDTLIVRTLDPAIVRVDGRTGAIGGRIRLDPAPPVAPCHRVGQRLAPDGALLVLITDAYGRACPPYPEGTWRYTVTGARLDPATQGFDTLFAIPEAERTGTKSPVFGSSLVFGLARDRLFVAASAIDSIVVIAYDGARLGVWQTGIERVTVPQDVVDRAASLRWKPEIPTHYPRFARLVADREGNLWVQAYARREVPYSWRDPAGDVAAGADWVVLDPDGQRIAQVRTPPGFYLLEAGDDYVIGVARPGMNEESVHLYALRKGP